MARKRAAILAARGFAEHKTKELPIVKASYHDLRSPQKNPKRGGGQRLRL
jgi:hypothetical protein